MANVDTGSLYISVNTFQFSTVIIIMTVVLVLSLIMIIVVNCVLKRRRLKKMVKIRLEEESQDLSEQC